MSLRMLRIKLLLVHFCWFMIACRISVNGQPGCELSPGSINTTLRQFCVGGTTAIGGTNSPYGPATGGSGSYTYTWQMQEGCTGGWNDIPGTNMTSYTPAAPPVTTCYRRKVTDNVCNTDAFTDFKTFEIFEDPVSQDIIPSPANLTICSGTFVSAVIYRWFRGLPRRIYGYI